jgi:hypothetical protein
VPKSGSIAPIFAWSTSPVLSDFAALTTNDAEYGGPAPASHGRRHSGPDNYAPAKSVEPDIRGGSTGSGRDLADDFVYVLGQLRSGHAARDVELTLLAVVVGAIALFLAISALPGQDQSRRQSSIFAVGPAGVG